MSDEWRRLVLLNAPYEPPEIAIGDWLECEVRGLLRVGGWSDGRIPWPRALRPGTRQLIVTAELARAVRTESAAAIVHWWGVNGATVGRWREVLGVERSSAGTRDLAGAVRRGKPMHPNTRAALLVTAKRPKSAEHRQRMSAAQKRRWREK